MGRMGVDGLSVLYFTEARKAQLQSGGAESRVEADELNEWRPSEQFAMLPQTSVT